MNGVESSFVGSSSSKHDDAIIFGVVMEGAIRSLRGKGSECFYLGPLHEGSMVNPDIIHVDRI